MVMKFYTGGYIKYSLQPCWESSRFWGLVATRASEKEPSSKVVVAGRGGGHRRATENG